MNPNPDEITLSDACATGLARFKQAGGPKEFLNSQREHLPVKSIAWAKLEETIAEKFSDLLHIKLRDVFLSAWKECQELHELADPEKYPPDREIPVPLSEHEIVSEHHPALEIDVAGLRVHRIVFDLTATLTLDGCELTVKGGRIVKWSVGSCSGRVELGWNKQVLFKTDTDPISALGPRLIEPGIPLSLAVAEKDDLKQPKRRNRSRASSQPVAEKANEKDAT